MPAVVAAADSFVVCVLWNEVPIISPGATALTLVPCVPNSLESARVKVRNTKNYSIIKLKSNKINNLFIINTLAPNYAIFSSSQTHIKGSITNLIY